MIFRNPVIFSDDNWGVQTPPKNKKLRLHETILSLGEWILRDIYLYIYHKYPIGFQSPSIFILPIIGL